MPRQPLSAIPARAKGRPPADMAVRRAILFGGALVVTLAAFSAPYELFRGDGFTWVELTGLALFTPLFIGISLWFCNALAGFILVATGRGDVLGLERIPPAPTARRTALLAVIRNEDSAAVFARLRAMDRALAAQGATAAFDIFVLSDTSDPAIAAQEALEYARAAAIAQTRLYYRRRSENTGRKAGNVADWVRRFGGAYDFMVVLDADSVMSADTLLRLAAWMDARPDLGLIQTIPSIVGGESLFARYVQFGTRLYGRMCAVGMAWWAGPEGLHWGHNAIVRVRAFAGAAGLPRLPGEPPFGGEILSHDVVEGWLMRRAGWTIAMAPMLDGSYEETPPTLMDNAQRDTRWCQGNLQHLGFLNADGLHWLSRLQMLMAAMVYAAAPLWLAFLAVGVTLRVQQGLPDPGAPWFSGGAERLLELHWSIVLTIVVLFSPKLMGAGLILANPAERRAFGGGYRLIASVGAELVISALIAPTHMLSCCRAIAGALIGRDRGWSPQRRRHKGAVWTEAWRFYAWQSAVGLGVLAIAAPYSDLVIWMAPILIGLTLAVPVAALSASAELGGLARRIGLFVTPEECEPPPLLRELASEPEPLRMPTPAEPAWVGQRLA